MSVSSALRRLLNVRDLEEEQGRVALESALGDLSRMQKAAAACGERDRRGRRLVEASARTGELADRMAGLEETRAAGRDTAFWAPRIADAQFLVAALREEYLAKRVERRQADTLIQEAEAQDAVESSRRTQQGLDDWYGNWLHRAEAKAGAAKAETSLPMRLAPSREGEELPSPGNLSEIGD